MRTISIIALALFSAMSGTALAQNNNSWCPAALTRHDHSQAEPGHRREVTLSPYTYHYSHNPEHRPVFAASFDHYASDSRFCGLSLFRNSFGQPSGYVYIGKRFDQLLGHPRLFGKVTAGVLYGYVDPYEDKVPLNWNGFSPAIVPVLGYKLSEDSSLQVNILGAAALMYSYGYRF